MQIRKPIYTADGRIDCEIEHPNYGWIPYTAFENLNDAREKSIYDAALKAKPAPYVAPPPPSPESLRPAMQLTRRQVFIGMAASGLITAPEAIAAASIGKPPATVEAAFLLMPAADQTAARITFGAFQTAYRDDPMTALFQVTAKMTDAQMDTFFTTYAAI